ncbi:MAG: ABC transporter permease [Pseudoxanthomonas sp.]
MFGYHLELALRSFRRSPGLTALMVLSIGVGVALAMSTWTLVHLMARDPVPGQSARLYFPTLDIWGPAARQDEPGREPPSMLDYSTAAALLADHRARRQAAVYWLTPTVVPSTPGQHPFNASAFAVSSEFFAMLQVPFAYGGAWSAADERARAQQVVISQALNDQLFGGGDSVGRTVGVGGRDYRVVGVLGDWNPQPTYYHVPAFGGFMLQPTGLFLPFDTAVAAQLPVEGNLQCATSPAESGFAGLLHSSCAWIGYLAELDTPAAAQRYRDYLAEFAGQRFDWRANVRLRDLRAWLDYQQVVPDGIRILRYVGAGLLLVCLVDTIGLLLAKFLHRSNEIGVRRALGASRSTLYAQFLVEGAMVGLAGGVAGIVLTWLGMRWLRARFPQGWEALTQLDAGVLALTLLVAVAATLLAALYPAWRAARVNPAWQVKTN